MRRTAPRTALLDFLAAERVGAIVTVAAAVAAMVWANAWPSGYERTWTRELPGGLSAGGYAADVGLALFFFVAGLELRRERLEGALSDLRVAALPVGAAVGGMVVPALAYLLVAGGTPYARGWAIPMATDVALALAVLLLAGPRVPTALRVLLLTLAVVDDAGTVLVIAVGYGRRPELAPLALAVLGVVGYLALQRRVFRGSGWLCLGVAVVTWLGLHRAGVSTTLGAALLGVVTRPPRLYAYESRLHPWASLVAVPLFVLGHAGVRIDTLPLTDRLGLAVAAGLLVGKPLGVLGGAALLVRSGAARLPPGVGWTDLLGLGLVAGIGLTISVYVADLALVGGPRDRAVSSVLAASLIAAGLGLAVLRRARPRRRPQAPMRSVTAASRSRRRAR